MASATPTSDQRQPACTVLTPCTNSACGRLVYTSHCLVGPKFDPGRSCAHVYNERVNAPVSSSSFAGWLALVGPSCSTTTTQWPTMVTLPCTPPLGWGDLLCLFVPPGCCFSLGGWVGGDPLSPSFLYLSPSSPSLPHPLCLFVLGAPSVRLSISIFV